MHFALKTTIAAIAIAAASPAFADANPATCSAATATSVSGGIAADACVGYYSGNLLNDSPTDLQNQSDALTDLLGTPTTVDQTLFNTLISGSLGGGVLSFGTDLFGEVVIGVHMGTVSGDDINDRTVFYLFNFGSAQTGINLGLTDTQKFSNAYLYDNGGAPVAEPGTWALMLLGFAGVGFAIRRRRRQGLLQIA
jgi:hypothetical protein